MRRIAILFGLCLAAPAFAGTPPAPAFTGTTTNPLASCAGMQVPQGTTCLQVGTQIGSFTAAESINVSGSNTSDFIDTAVNGVLHFYVKPSGLISTVAGLSSGGPISDSSTFTVSLIDTSQTASAAFTVPTSDCGGLIRDTGATGHTYTVPTGLPLGCRIDIIQVGAGAVTISAGTGETLEAVGSANTTTGAGAHAQIIIDSASTFEVHG